MLFINGKEYIYNRNYTTKEDIASFLNLRRSEFYLINNGRKVDEVENLQECRVEVVLRLRGGKGGFGSMLRAIGAQIEKTTNREACRDLSGRRLRDINEEKRLKAWIGQQADRERDTEDRRKKRIERLCQKPKHEFRDDNYEKERSELTDRVEDALEHGLSLDKGKRKSQTITTDKKKKPRLWLGSDEELSTSDEDADMDDGNVSSIPCTSKVGESSNSGSVSIIDTQEESKICEEQQTVSILTKESEETNEREVNEHLDKKEEKICSDIQTEEK